jgi:hypothetical protein
MAVLAQDDPVASARLYRAALKHARWLHDEVPGNAELANIVIGLEARLSRLPTEESRPDAVER